MTENDSCRRDVSFKDQTPAATPGSTGRMFERLLNEPEVSAETNYTDGLYSTSRVTQMHPPPQ